MRAISVVGRSPYSNEASALVPIGDKIQVSRRLALPRTRVGGSSSQSLVIRNVGSGPLAGTVGPLPLPFTVLSGGGRFLLAPGQSMVVVIGFAPTERARYVSTLVIYRTDIEHPIANVSIVGDALGRRPSL